MDSLLVAADNLTIIKVIAWEVDIVVDVCHGLDFVILTFITCRVSHTITSQMSPANLMWMSPLKKMVMGVVESSLVPVRA